MQSREWIASDRNWLFFKPWRKTISKFILRNPYFVAGNKSQLMTCPSWASVTEPSPIKRIDHLEQESRKENCQFRRRKGTTMYAVLQLHFLTIVRWLSDELMLRIEGIPVKVWPSSHVLDRLVERQTTYVSRNFIREFIRELGHEKLWGLFKNTIYPVPFWSKVIWQHNLARSER